MGVSWTPEEMGAQVDDDGSIIDAESWEDTPTKTEPETVDAETGEALRARANALTGERIIEFKRWLNEKEITGFPLNMRANKVKVVAAYLDLLEKQAKDAAGVDTPNTPPESEPRVTEGERIPPPPGVEDEDGIITAEILPDDEPDGDVPAMVDLGSGWEFDDVVSMAAEAMEQLPDDVLRNACIAFRRPAQPGLNHAQLIAAVVAARDAA